MRKRGTISKMSVLAVSLLLGFGAEAHAAKTKISASQGQAMLTDAKYGHLMPLENAIAQIEEPVLVALARAQIAASELNGAAATRALDMYFASGDTNPARQAQAWSIAATTAFAERDYAAARKAAEQWSARLAQNDPAHEAGEVAQLLGIASQLVSVRAQTVIQRAPHSIPTTRDKAGLIRAETSINGTTQQAVFDTGANLSVLSASAARRLNVHLLDGSGSVASSTKSAVAVRLGLAERVDIAGVSLANVVFLVLDDAQLQMPLPGGYSIDAIIGFPVFRALDRITFNESGSFTPGRAKRSASPGNLRAYGSDLFVAVEVGGVPTALHLDTGAANSELSAEFARRNAAVIDGLVKDVRSTASAGGSTQQKTAVWKQVDVRLSGQTLTLPKLAVAVEDSADVKTKSLGVLGQDVLRAFDSYTIDFSNMRFELSERRAAAAQKASDNSLSAR